MVGNVLTPTHLLLVLVVALIVLGPKRLPSAGRGLGEAMRGFKDALTSGDQSDPTGHQIYDAHHITQAIDAAGASPTSHATSPAHPAAVSPSTSNSPRPAPTGEAEDLSRSSSGPETPSTG